MPDSTSSPERFYDDLAADYHLVFSDWDRAISWQADILANILSEHSPTVRRVLDASSGIGTQALGLAALGYQITATDISEASVRRCAAEAQRRGLDIDTAVADLRTLDRDLTDNFDAVISFDNSLPHLVTDDDLQSACAAARKVLRPSGLFCASIRDYDSLLQTRPSGELPRTHTTDVGERIVFQVWEWSGEQQYNVRHFILKREGSGWNVTERQTQYRALTRAQLEKALRDSGFGPITWLMPAETGFYQPIVKACAAESPRGARS